MTMELKRADDASESPYELAADWLQRLDDPQLAEEDLQAWLEWFEASDANRKAFEELQLMRQRFRVLPQQDQEELKRRIEPQQDQDELKRRVEPQQDQEELKRRVEPQQDQEELKRRVERPVERRPRFGNVWALAAAVGAVAIGGGWWVTQTRGIETYAAAENHHRTVVLTDGSSLVLAANSVVDVTYSPTKRFLNIQRGEAYFEVAHNRFRPFMVQAGEVRVTAVGTDFNVQRRSDQVTVTVTEGKVRVSQGEDSPRTTVESGTTRTIATERVLAVGQQAVLPVVAAVKTTPAATVAPDWSGDTARFINAPLRDVLPVINRHASTRLSIEDPRVADLTYSGTIFRSHVDEWITSLPQVFPVRAVALQDGSVTLVSRERDAEP